MKSTRISAIGWIILGVVFYGIGIITVVQMWLTGFFLCEAPMAFVRPHLAHIILVGIGGLLSVVLCAWLAIHDLELGTKLWKDNSR
jgi:hypothetical protein